MKAESLFLGDWEILPGQTRLIQEPIARLPSHTTIQLALSVSRAEEDGPVLLLMGGLHGDEINGIEIVRRIIEDNLHIPDRGTVICIPILNLYGFINFSRAVPDGKDINRSFPGNRNGSLASRVAYQLMRDVIPKIDYGIDFHTGGASRTNYPQIRCVLSDETNEEFAKAFDPPFILDSKYRPNSLRQAAAKLGKKILVYEGGESSRFDENAIQEGIKGTLRLMKHLGMRSDVPEEDERSAIVIRNSSWVRARNSGLFKSLVQSGQAVHKNQHIGYITDTFGEFKIKVKCPASGYVIGLNNDPVVLQGDALMHIGVIR